MSSTDVAVPDDYEGPEGLEDFDPNDTSIPVIKIDHDEGKFIDTLSGKSYEQIELIVLGLVKQRVLWPAEMGEEARPPLCKAYDAKVGHPDLKDFPWKAAGFLEFRPDDPDDEEQNVTLPCEKCPLKGWGTHPKRDIPWCSEQHTLVVLQKVGTADGDIMAPALLTFQRSSLKPSANYLSSFARAREGTFVCWTKIKLKKRTRGSVDFAIPIFTRGDDTPEEEHAAFAQKYREIRQFLQTPRNDEEEHVRDEELETGDATTSVAPPAAEAAPVPAAPPAAAQPATVPAAAPTAATAEQAAAKAEEPPAAPQVPAAGDATPAPPKDDDLPF